jgi:ubiquinol-cytochrome c reductase cytochrome b subunit
MIISSIGYVLPWGQMSFWGCTVITNLLYIIPCFVSWICGGFYISNPSLCRFFILHYMLSFLILAFIIIHIFYLHYISSNNIYNYNINNKISFYPFYINKDLYNIYIIFIIFILEIFYNIISLLHPDNTYEINILITPLHIVPE